jgi:CRISPR system Cascade subunit CasD
MSCLALELTAPLQSWGLTSRAGHRDTAFEPTKSGVVGMLAAALGRQREEPVDDLAALRMTVRVDREGEVTEDFQTIGVGYSRDPIWPAAGIWTAAGKGLSRFPQVSPRDYLADAAFLVVFEGDPQLLAQLFAALRSPCFQLALGRRACPPGQPLAPAAPAEVSIDDVLARYPRLRPGNDKLRVVKEIHPRDLAMADELRPDQPIGALKDRRFGPRPIKHESVRTS